MGGQGHRAWERGRIAPADREHLARWLTQFDAGARAAFALVGCTGWRYVVDEMAKAGVQPHLAEPADTAALRGPKRRAKSDKRDARRLTRLHRSGQLVAIAVPTPAQEAVRDLCRARVALVYDRRRARQRLDKFLLRHDRVYTAGRAWTARHEQWLAGQRFDDAALRATYAHYRGVASARNAELVAIEATLARWVDTGPFAAATHRLACYLGIAYLGGLTLASEVFDWRRFGSAMRFMGFTGLVPSEYSSGESVRRGHITKAGNGYVRTQLIESAWSYQHHAAGGADLKRRQEHADPATIARSWAAQQRLCGRFRRLANHKTTTKIVVTAIARELAGFLWAEMVAV